MCPQPAGEPPPTRGSCFFAKFTADFIFSGNSRNFNCPIFHLKHSFSKLRGIYKCFMNALAAFCLSYCPLVKDPLARIPCRGRPKVIFKQEPCIVCFPFIKLLSKVLCLPDKFLQTQYNTRKIDVAQNNTHKKLSSEIKSMAPSGGQICN